MIRYRLSNHRYHLLNRKCIYRIHFVNESLEVFHFGGAFEDDCELIACDATIVEEHAVDDAAVEEFASFSQTLAVAIAKVIVLQAKSFSVDFVEDW